MLVSLIVISIKVSSPKLDENMVDREDSSTFWSDGYRKGV